MKTNRFTHPVIAAFALAAFSTAGCAKEQKVAEIPVAAPKDPAPDSVTPPAPAVRAVVPVAAMSSDDAAAKWSSIRDCTYDTRDQFFAGLKDLEKRADDEISELNATRAAMASTTSTREWDLAMKWMNESRAYLKDMGDVLRKSTPDTWSQAKDNVGIAWVRTQDAYDKVKHSTTT
jgi:hypothetical protein